MYSHKKVGTGQRLLRAEADLLSQIVEKPEQVVELFRGLEDERATKVISLKMDAEAQILDCEVVGLGGEAATLMDPRVIVRGALGALVDSIILVLNHPDTSATPTPAELAAYQTLVDLGQTLGFRVLDLVIVAKDDWFSVRATDSTR